MILARIGGFLVRVSCFAVFFSWFSTPMATAQSAPPKAAGTLSYIERLEIEATLADRAFQHANDSTNVGLVVLAFERFVGAVCMPNVAKTLRHFGMASNSEAKPQCQTALARLLEIDPNNPVGVCVTEGIDNIRCHRAAEAQKVEMFTVSSDYSRYGVSGGKNPAPVDLETRLIMARAEPKIDELESKIRQLEAKVTEKPALGAEIRQAYREILALSCRVVRLRLSDTVVPTPTAAVAPTPTLGPGTGPMAEVLASIPEITAATPAAGAELKFPVRTRFVSERCGGLIDAARKFDPVFALPMCYRHGFYSPRCIIARRSERAAREAEEKKKRALGITDTPQPGARKNNINGQLEVF